MVNISNQYTALKFCKYKSSCVMALTEDSLEYMRYPDLQSKLIFVRKHFTERWKPLQKICSIDHDSSSSVSELV